MRPPARPIAGALAAGLLVAACTVGAASNAPDSPLPTAQPTPTQAPSTPGYAISSNPDELVLRIDTQGGLIAPGYFLSHFPAFSLYADGRVVTPGAVDTIYPSPLLPNILEAKLTPADVQKVVAAADEAGLLGPDASYDAANVADAGTTTFATTVGGKTHRISAYALGIGNDPTLDSAVAQVRSKLDAFRTKLLDLSSLLGRTIDQSPYAPAALRIFVAEPYQVDPPLIQQEVAWPLSVDPASGLATMVPGTRCLLVAGGDLGRFLAVARTANALTVWKAAAGRYSVQVRPLLPGEDGCA